LDIFYFLKLEIPRTIGFTNMYGGRRGESNQKKVARASSPHPDELPFIR
jgi:hypothetical protein